MGKVLFVIVVAIMLFCKYMCSGGSSSCGSYTYVDNDFEKKQAARRHERKVNTAKQSYQNALHQVEVEEKLGNIDGSLASRKRYADEKYADLLATMAERE